MSLSGLHWYPLFFISSSRHVSESHIEGLENPVKKQSTKFNDSTSRANQNEKCYIFSSVYVFLLEFLKIYCTSSNNCSNNGTHYKTSFGFIDL